MASEFDGWELWEKEQREKAEQEAEIKNIVRKMMFESLTNGFRQMVRELVAEELYGMMPIIKAQLRYVEEDHSEIIACADCKHWICHDKRCGYWNHGVKPLEWCCHAERRTT